MATRWSEIGDSLAADCPSPTIRRAAANILERAELVGPLRPPQEEFRRVYHFLHWNEPDRVLAITNALLARAKGPHPQTTIRANAWGYIVAMLDEWITHARIFYVVSGILEGTLRARLDAHLTDKLGTADWPDLPDAAPSALREYAPKNEQRDAQLVEIHRLLDASQADGIEAKDALIAGIRNALMPQPLNVPRRGAVFVRNLTFGGLKMFFMKKKTWTGKTQLQDIFRSSSASPPPLREKLVSVLETLNDARNEVAHYRPSRYLTFEQPLFDAALLAHWLGKDIQHIYESIDTRSSTELSVLLGPLANETKWAEGTNVACCSLNNCAVSPPFDWLMSRAPRDRSDLDAVTAARACSYHRIQTRVALHRPT